LGTCFLGGGFVGVLLEGVGGGFGGGGLGILGQSGRVNGMRRSGMVVRYCEMAGLLSMTALRTCFFESN
jgi:hypothetical protein